MCLSKNKVAFYEARAHSITPVKIYDLVPMGMEEMDFDREVAVLQVHGGTQVMPQFHGHGGRRDKQEIKVEKYIRAIDDGLIQMLHDEHIPMVFMGVEELFAAYRDVNSYRNLLDEHISGNPFSWGVGEIQERAWGIARKYFDKEKQENMEAFEAQTHLNITSNQITDILFAAEEGRVDKLFTRDDQNLWGNYKASHRRINIHPMRSVESECLLNTATLAALQTDAQVFNLPESALKSFQQSPIAAVFRY